MYRNPVAAFIASKDRNKYRFANVLRENQTPGEIALAKILKPFQKEGYTVRPQEVVWGYIADFYIPERKLIIEVDGSVHHSEVARVKDAWRTRNLARRGIQVLRISNAEALTAPYKAHHKVEEALGIAVRMPQRKVAKAHYAKRQYGRRWEVTRSIGKWKECIGSYDSESEAALAVSQHREKDRQCGVATTSPKLCY